MADERKQDLKEKAAQLRKRMEERRKWRAESDKRLDAAIQELRELAGRR